MSIDLEEEYEKIYRYCYMKLRNQHLAEDITQETFLRFLEEGCYEERGKRLSYLYTIARNRCIDFYRSKKWERLEEEIPAESQEERLLTVLELQRAVGALDTQEQELIFLRYVNEVPIQEIGRILGISRFAVYRKIREILKKMKISLREEEHP